MITLDRFVRWIAAVPLAVCALGGATGAAPAWGAERAPGADQVGGVSFAPTATAEGATLVRNGAGLRVFYLMVDGYASALYLPAPAHTLAAVLDEPGPKVIETVFLHAASVTQLRAELDRVHDGYCRHHGCTSTVEQDYRRLLAHEAPVRAGERETILVSADGVRVSRDGVPTTIVTDGGFGRVLLASMLGPSAPTARYRNGLLGLGN